MSEDIELRLLREIEELKRELKLLKGIDENQIPTYSFSKIRDKELNELFDIEQLVDKTKFLDWFENEITLDPKIENMLIELLNDEADYITFYDEEDLKMRFLSPLLRSVNFKSDTFRDFYDEKITYSTDKFILSGEVDFTISKGLRDAKIPYFFIQEFKRAEEFSNPRPQLLAELISAIELNNWTTIKGAYIVGAIWNFVILERLDKHKYQYFVSQNFDSTKIEDLKDIYKNLLFVKKEIIEMIKNEE
jgi:hypothetical protein